MQLNIVTGQVQPGSGYGYRTHLPELLDAEKTACQDRIRQNSVPTSFGFLWFTHLRTTAQ